MAEQLGSFLLLRRIGVGGMAEVYLARSGGGALPPHCVIKRMLPHLTEGRDFVQMFSDEAWVAARLKHPNLLTLYETGAFNGVPFMVLEFVDGVNLAALMDHLVERKVPLPLPVALYVVAQACHGLHHAHEARDENGVPMELVHRDVSPHNIMMSRNGEVKLLDFGIAKTAVQSNLTKTGVLKGKLSYMAPEYCSGAPVDRRADVFAMGVTLYELLTGTRLFADASPLMVVKRITQDDVPPPSRINPNIPAVLDAVVAQATARTHKRRFRDALSLAKHLEDVLDRHRWQMNPAVLGQWLVENAAGILPPRPEVLGAMEEPPAVVGRELVASPAELVARVREGRTSTLTQESEIGRPVQGTPLPTARSWTDTSTQRLDPVPPGSPLAVVPGTPLPVEAPRPFTQAPTQLLPFQGGTPAPAQRFTAGSSSSSRLRVPDEWAQVDRIVTHPEPAQGTPVPATDLICTELRCAAGFASELNQMFADIFERLAQARTLSNGAAPATKTRQWKAKDTDPFTPAGQALDPRLLNRQFYARLFAKDALGGRIKGGEKRFVSWGSRERAFEHAGVEMTGGVWVPFLHVSRAEPVLNLVAELGGRIVQPLRRAQEGAFAIIQDPMGATLGLLEPAAAH